MTTRDKRSGTAAGLPEMAGQNADPLAKPGDGWTSPSAPATAGEVADFVQKMRTFARSDTGRRGRLVFAMDATMSRQPTWDMALSLQAGMFQVVKDVGGLDVQLVYFRGAGECRASRWVSDPTDLARLMTTVSCRGGTTQIGRVLSHAAAEARGKTVDALVFVGDAMEESIDPLCSVAGELALLGVPVFLFQEGHDPLVSSGYTEIARITRGATCRFDHGSADQLRALLTAVAVYASGGRKALLALAERSDGSGARRLLPHLEQGR